MSGYCLYGEHEDCPDTHDDTYGCTCPCHLDQESEDEE